MKQYRSNLIMAALVFLAFAAGARMFYLDTMLDNEGQRNIYHLIKDFFLDAQNNRISANDLLFCFTAFLFMGYNLNISSYGITKKYRAMVLLRYQSRKKYFSSMYQSMTVRGALITVISLASFLLAAWINHIPFHFSDHGFYSSAILVVNIFLYLNVLGLINIYIAIKYKDTTALMLTSLVTGILLFVDAYEPFFAVITYGEIGMEARGALLLILCNIILFFVAEKNIKKNDVL